MSLEVLVDGFKAGCRPFIGLDGCFLKHKIKKAIHDAIKIDACGGKFSENFSTS